MAETTLANIRRFSSRQYDPLRNFKFFVEFLDADSGKSILSKGAAGAPKAFTGGFTQVQGLTINTQNIQYREGGFNTTVHNLPGMTSFQPLVLNRGMVYGQDQAIAWMRGLFDTSGGTGRSVIGSDFRMNVRIYVNDHPAVAGAPGVDAAGAVNGVPARVMFEAHNAWITSLAYTDLNGTDNNVLFEQMTLVHEGLSVTFTDPAGKPQDGIASAYSNI